ncbi:MAG: HAD-IC family P-type ATPase, partial [Gemmatimonadota bacterium]
MAQPKPTAELLPLPDPPHTMPASEVERLLGTAADGLSEDDARRRLAHYGPNELETEREEPWWQILLDQFRDPLIYILLIAAFVTAVISDYKDMAVILAVVVLNAVIGFVQEYRARKAVRALARLAAPKADALRDGEPRAVPGRELVPGDVVLLASGSLVPADLRLTSVRDLEVDESALTGESAPVRKTTEAIEGDALVPGDRLNSAFAGTVVTRGRGRGVVVRTGASTELGRIASAVREVGRTETPLQEKSERFGRRIGFVILVLAVLIVVIDLLRGASVFEILLTAVAMAVAAIPEALPVVLTVTLAVGVRRMAQRRAIIRSLPAVETLGSTTAIGSDKTGTLTKNEMTVRAIRTAGAQYDVTGTGYGAAGAIERDGRPVEAGADPALRRVLLIGVLANEADPAAVATEEPRGDPTELALY